MHLSYRHALALTFGLSFHLLPEMREWEKEEERTGKKSEWKQDRCVCVCVNRFSFLDR